jgi:hypothetical protein
VADHDHEIQFSFNGMIKPVPVLPQAELDALNGLCIDALRNQPLEAAPALAALRGSLSVWRGQSSGAARMKAIRPVRTVIESGRTTFRWRPVLGAKRYTVHVVDDQTQEETATSPAIFPSTNASVCEWSGVPSLTRGKRYRWYVAAAIEEQEIDAPGNEEAPARFSVLSEADLIHLNELKHASHNDRLIGALLDLRVGVLDDAEDDFRSLSDEPSQTPNGKAFLSRLIEGIEHLKE